MTSRVWDKTGKNYLQRLPTFVHGNYKVLRSAFVKFADTKLERRENQSICFEGRDAIQKTSVG